MADDSTLDYFMKRAAKERDLAARARDNTAAIRHFELAELYDERVKGRVVGSTLCERG